MHFPYFKDLNAQQLTDFEGIEPATASEKFSAGATALTEEVANVGHMDTTSTVLDLGCGYGKPLMDLVRHADVKKAVGLDLATRHVVEGNRVAGEDPALRNRVSFTEGSYLDLPKELE